MTNWICLIYLIYLKDIFCVYFLEKTNSLVGVCHKWTWLSPSSFQRQTTLIRCLMTEVKIVTAVKKTRRKRGSNSTCNQKVESFIITFIYKSILTPLSCCLNDTIHRNLKIRPFKSSNLNAIQFLLALLKSSSITM